MVTVLVLASFLLFVNFARVIAGRVVGAGLLGEILIGAVYAAPLASILPASVQYSLQSLGYLGLMLLIVEGGLNTRLDILTQRSTALLAICTASVGIILPIAFSFALLPPAFGFRWIESFACGSALASTSLGTVFSVIASTNSNLAAKMAHDSPEHHQDSRDENASNNLANTKVGTILVGAALLDDIVGLVLSSVVTNLSSGQPGVTRSLAPWTAARPVVASICLLLISSLVARWVLSPLLMRYGDQAAQSLHQARGYRHVAPWLPGIRLFLFLATTLSFASIASYIGSSNLIGCFCAGAFMKYAWQIFGSACSRYDEDDQRVISHFSPHLSLEAIMPVGKCILIPFFFASIGAAIPIRKMFVGSIVWKGFIYTGLMGIAKALAGGCLSVAGLHRSTSPSQKPNVNHASVADGQIGLADLPSIHGPPRQQSSVASSRLNAASWPPALFLGVCLVARGEIGFLIINLAYQGGLVEQEAFLVSVWAITLNTVIGPASIGIFLKTDVGRSIEKGRWGRIDKANRL